MFEEHGKEGDGKVVGAIEHTDQGVIWTMMKKGIKDVKIRQN